MSKKPKAEVISGITRIEASDDDAKRLIKLKPNATGDTRSGWYWMRLPDGDLILACYPQGDTYIEISERINMV